MKQILLPSSCLGCATRLVAFRHKQDKEWSSMYLTCLSDHAHLWHDCWRGRFYLAWRALRGLQIEDIACETLDEMKALHQAIGEMVAYVEQSDE